MIVNTGYVLWLHEDNQYNYNLNSITESQGRGLTDYKFYCFNGTAKYLYVSSGLADHESAKISFLTPEWKAAPFGRSDYASYDELPDKPVHYKKMLEIAECLSGGIPFLRVDLYEINNRIYFSELTFYPAGGYMPFVPEEWDRKLGNELILHSYKEG